MNVAATETSTPGARSQAPVPPQAPDQPAKLASPSMTGSMCTGGSRGTENQHVPRQSPWSPEERTAPGPDTATVTVALAVYWPQAVAKAASSNIQLRMLDPPAEACARTSAGARGMRPPARPSCGSMRRAIAPRRGPPVPAPLDRIRLALRLLREAEQPQRAGPRLRGPRARRARHVEDRDPRAPARPRRRSGTCVLGLGLRERQGADLRRSRRAAAGLRGAAVPGKSSGGFAPGRPGARRDEDLRTVEEGAGCV